MALTPQLRMLRPTLAGLPRLELPDGYALRSSQPGDAAHWLAIDDVRALETRHRSPMIMRCIDDWHAGKRYPLDLVTHYA